MQIDTARFGVLEPADEQVVRIEGGVLGFPDSKRFMALPVTDADGWAWLQSVDDPELAFLTVSVFRFFSDYDFELPDDDADAMELDNPADAEVLALVTVHRGDSGSLEQLTANLMGPIVINSRNRLGRQVVLPDSGYTTREPIVA